MGILRRIILSVIMTAVTLSVFLFFSYYSIIRESYRSSEIKLMERDLILIDTSIKEMISVVEEKSGDWAAWDDSYNFISDSNEAFARSNLSLDSLRTLKCNLMVFMDNQGKVVNSFTVIPGIPENNSLPAFLKKLLPDIAVHGSVENKKSGLISDGTVLLAFSSLPITTSDRKGVPKGSFILGRILGSDTEKYFNRILKNDVSITLSRNASLNMLSVDFNSPAIISGTLRLDDIYGKPCAVVTVKRPPSGVENFHNNTGYMVLFMILSMLAFIASITFMIKYSLLDRLMKIIKSAGLISSGEKDKVSFLVEGSDELSFLSKELDEMVRSLDKTQYALKESESDFRRVIGNFQDAYFRTDNSGRIVMVNPSFVDMFGLQSLKEAEGMELGRIFSDGRERKLFYDIMNADEKINDYIFGARRMNGSSLDISATCSVCRDEKGVVFGIEGLLRDVSVRMREQEELRQAKLEAEKANMAKSEFLASMSHEIRTPINSILGFSDMLRKTGIDEKQRNIVEYIRTGGKSLLSIVNNVLDFSKIEAGITELSSEEFDVHELINDAISVNRLVADGKKLELSSSIDKDISYNVIGDQGKLRQILLNLVNNAVKFTEKGSVRISASIINSSSDMSLIEFKVADTGIGISRSVEARIFNPFVQADGSITRKYGGTGLGLAISNRLVKLIGEGRIFLKTEEGSGSTFSFMINFRKGAPLSNKVPVAFKNASSAGTRSGAPLNILIVEDTPLNVELMKMALSANGHSIFVAENGRLGVEAVKNSDLDCVLMDIHMPVMDGYEATRAIRESGNEIPIIAMTADIMDSTRRRCIETGMDEYVPKPVAVDEIEKLIESIISRKKSGKMRSVQAASPEGGTSAADTARAPEPPVFDYEKLLKNMGGNRQVINMLVKKFISDSEEINANLLKAISDSDCPGVRHYSHKIKGMALMMCADRVAAAYLRLEVDAREGRASDFDDLFQSASNEFREFITEAEALVHQ